MDDYPLTPELMPLVGTERPLRILVGFDQSGEEAIEFAGWFARTLPSRVRVVATAKRPWSSLGSKSKQYRKWLKKTTDRSEEHIRAALKGSVPRSAWDDEFAVFREGKPRHDLLTQEAQRFNADLIVLGSKPKAAKGRFMASSTADALLHSSPISLGLTPRAAKLSKKGITRVNFAFLDDDDEATSSGIAAAASVAIVLDTELRIMAFSPEETYCFDGELRANRTLVDEWNETSLALLDRARDTVTEIARRIGVNELKNFEVETCVSAGDGWATVVDSQKWKKGDVLFLGSRPSAAQRVNVGQRASDFLRHVPVPVIIFPQR